MKHFVGTALLAAFATVAAPVVAAPVVTTVRADLSVSLFTFSFGASGDFFAPLSVSTGGSGLVNSFFGSPTTFFVDRGVVSFGPNAFPAGFTEFPTVTTVPFSNGDNFIGLRSTSGGRNFYGFVYTTNAVLNSYGFETVADQTIVATTELAAAVPEPGTWALMIVGFGAVGYGLRRRRVRVSPAA